MNEGKADNIDESRIRQLNALGFKWKLSAKDQPALQDESDDEDTSGSRTKSKTAASASAPPAPANITPQPVAMKTISFSQSQTETNYSYLMCIKNSELPQVWGSLLHFEPKIVGFGYNDTNWKMQDATHSFVESLMNGGPYSGLNTVPANMFENHCVDDLISLEFES